MTDETVISAKSLDLTFQTDDGPVHALKDVNLDITKGDFISFIGPSGCGKTTFLRVMADLDQPTDGTITINGVSPKRNKLKFGTEGTAFLGALKLEIGRASCRERV